MTSSRMSSAWRCWTVTTFSRSGSAYPYSERHSDSRTKTTRSRPAREEFADAVAEGAFGETPPVDDLERLTVVGHDLDDLLAEFEDAVEVVEVDVRREQDRVQHRREFRHDDPAGDAAEFVHVDDVPVDRRLRHPDPRGHVDRRQRSRSVLAEDGRRHLDDLIAPVHRSNRTGRCLAHEVDPSANRWHTDGRVRRPTRSELARSTHPVARRPHRRACSRPPRRGVVCFFGTVSRSPPRIRTHDPPSKNLQEASRSWLTESPAPRR